MGKKFKRILYGGDYNPEQWPREIWDEDMRILKKARINSATVNVFSWAKLQPDEETYDFTELDEIIDMLSKENYDIVLGTPTASVPAWMAKRYPEVMRTDFGGIHHKLNARGNICPNSPVFQKYAKALVSKLAERYGRNEHVTCWHINNEYGGICYCENCEKAFRVWLQEKYKTIDALNEAWNLAIWGNTVYEWDEIVAPNVLGVGNPGGRTAFQVISLDYQRFFSDAMLESYKLERDAIREFDKETPHTTNFMPMWKCFDYFKWAKDMDLISYDCYPNYKEPLCFTSMGFDLTRSLKNAPFMLMEQTPSHTNWQRYNPLKRPGQMRAQSYLTMAHGADSIHFFQLRRCVSGEEKFHGSVIDHVGTEDTRVFREVKQLGEELEKLGTGILGAENEAEVGIVFDWDNFWALEYSSGPNIDLKYVDSILAYYRFFHERNIGVDMVPWDANFSKYKVIVAPVLYMVKEGMKEALEAFVQSGGTLITTYMSGMVNSLDKVYLGGYPGPLREMVGVWVEEIDSLPPEWSNEVIFKDGTKESCDLLCDLIHLEGAECLAEYGKDFYAGMPAVTKNCYGQGKVYYIGTRMTEAGLDKVLSMAIKDAQVAPVLPDADGLHITCRKTESCSYYFVMNFKDEIFTVPSSLVGKEDILSGKVMEADTEISKYDVKIICMKK